MSVLSANAEARDSDTRSSTGRRSQAARPRRQVFCLTGALLIAAGLIGNAPTAEAAETTTSHADGSAYLDEVRCLALNIYHEARGESDAGKVAVGHVVMNRVYDSSFPEAVCRVVAQGGERPLHRCQFSWWCDGRSDTPTDWRAWDKSKHLALLVYHGLYRDPTKGALWYHAEYVAPAWTRAYKRGPKIGRHIFYQRYGKRIRRAISRRNATHAPSNDFVTIRPGKGAADRFHVAAHSIPSLAGPFMLDIAWAPNVGKFLPHPSVAGWIMSTRLKAARPWHR